MCIPHKEDKSGYIITGLLFPYAGAASCLVYFLIHKFYFINVIYIFVIKVCLSKECTCPYKAVTSEQFIIAHHDVPKYF